MRHFPRLFAIAAIAVLLAGCFGQAASPTASTPLTTPVPQATPASEAPSTDGPATDEPNPIGSDDPMGPEGEGPFSCDLPIHVDATVPRANLAATRIGMHDGYDRIVFEFIQGLPEVSIERAEPPFAQDGSGLPIEVDGESFLRITMRGGTKQMDDGSSSYDGATEYNPGFPALTPI